MNHSVSLNAFNETFTSNDMMFFFHVTFQTFTLRLQLCHKRIFKDVLAFIVVLLLGLLCPDKICII